MSAKLLATTDCTFKFEDPAHSGTIVATYVPATKVKCDGVPCWTSVVLALTACTNGTVSAGTGAGTLMGDSSKVKTYTLSLGRKDTKLASILITGVVGSSTGTYTTTVVVDDPGQSKVKAE